jgi:asparagine synthase (glutamine-hydrolysing)
MCGIAGVYNWDSPAPMREVVGEMTERLARRGPDGAGIHSEPGVGLGHRRLSIIDLSERGAQPMSNEDGSVWLTFNGEIYNYRELRRGLEARGHHFRSDADSEVLIHLYEDKGDDLRDYLGAVRGMFAFAIWDARRRRLLLARDRLGIKPLLYYAGDGALAFASDLDALTACPWVPRRLDWTSLYEYLILLTVPGPSTIFRDVKYLRPGHALVAERGTIREAPYWELSPEVDDPITKPGEADEAVAAALGDAVGAHMVADVEVGAFLSGGVDSGVVTALATETSGCPLRTFSATFPGEAVDEGPWAREAAGKLGTSHTEFASTGGFLEGIESVVEAMDQPLALTSAVSLFHLSRMAREHVKVVLTGDGGDELFAGYNRHRQYPAPARAVSWVPHRARPTAGRVGRAVLPAWARRRSRTLGKAYTVSTLLARDESELYVPRTYYLQPDEALGLLPPDAAPAVEVDRHLDRAKALFSRCRYADPVSRMLFVDLQTSLADEMLSKVDRMTMAHGLEARVPLLDHRVVELGMRVSGAVKRNGELGKLPLRRLASSRLGDEVGTRSKHGFNSPLDVWLSGDGHTRAKVEALWPSVEKSGAFGADAARRVASRNGGATAMNLFSLLVYGLWAEQRGVCAA